jgi:hypothetical protein
MVRSQACKWCLMQRRLNRTPPLLHRRWDEATPEVDFPAEMQLSSAATSEVCIG